MCALTPEEEFVIIEMVSLALKPQQQAWSPINEQSAQRWAILRNEAREKAEFIIDERQRFLVESVTPVISTMEKKELLNLDITNIFVVNGPKNKDWNLLRV